MSYDILAIACLHLLCVSECMYVSMCIYVYVCMYDVRHDIQIPCTRYVAINRLYLYLYLNFLLLFARVQPSAGIKMVLHYSDELLIINKIAKSQPQWNFW